MNGWYDELLISLKSEFPSFEESYLLYMLKAVAYKLQSLENDISDSKTYSAFELNWIHMASREVLIKEMNTGISSAIRYVENGYTVEYDNAFISKDLENMIKPKAKGII